MWSDKKEELSILIYISTSKISASFAVFANGKNPKIIHNVVSFFPAGLKLDDFNSPSTVSTLLDTTLTLLFKEGSGVVAHKIEEKDIKSVAVTFSAPWFVSKTKELHLEQKTPFIVTENFINNILQVEEKTFEKEILSTETDGKYSGGLAIIENTFTHSKVNGYSIPNNFGKKTDNFDISLYTSFASRDIVKNLLSQIHKHTNLSVDKIHINTFPLVFFYAIRNMFSTVNSFIFMNVEGEVTDLTLVHDGGINHNISFPSAKNFLLRKIAKSFDVSPEIADSMVHMYNAKKMDDEYQEKMRMALDDVEREWSIYFEDSLSELSNKAALPATIYMVADPEIASIYENFMKMSKADITFTLRKNLNIVHIDSGSFSNYCDFDLSVRKDEYTAMLSVFHNKIKLGNV